jgi:L-lactate dehydrogenase
MKEITKSVMEHYTKGIILMVSNPVDVLTYKFQQWSGLPVHKVVGSGTVLDSSRLKFHLGEKLGVDANDVNAFIIGEHGDSQIPLWSHITIGGMKLDDFCQAYGIAMGDEGKAALSAEVKTSGATVIKTKGATYYAIALSVSRIVEAILKDQNAILPVGNVIHDGPYGLKNVALAMPSVVNSEGIGKMIELKLSDEEVKALQYSAEQVGAIIRELDNI